MALKGLAEALYGEIAGQKDRLFLWLPVLLGLGITIYFCLPFEPPVEVAALLFAFGLPAVLYTFRHQHDGVWQLVRYLAAMAVLMVAMGFLAATVSTRLYGTPLLEKSIRFTQLTGTIDTIEDLGGTDGSRVVLTHISIRDLEPDETPVKIRLRIRKDQGLKAGQVISVTAKLDPTSPPVLPGAYDFQRHLFFQGIGAVGFAYSQPEILQGVKPSEASVFFEELRAAIYKRIESHAGTASAGIMNALITGQRGAIEKTDDDAMRESGLYHLLSISGTHVSMVAAALFFFSRFFMALIPWMALHWPIKKIAAVIAMLGVTFYTVLAGADVPAVRSVLMTGLVLFAIVIDRSPLSLRLIAFAALVVLITTPFSLIGVSFQMSFAAVAALICFFEYIQPVWTRLYSRAGIIRKTLLYLIGLVMTSVIAGGMTGLFGLYHFQQFAVYGVISNMIAVPLTGFIVMPAAIVALILMPFGLDGWALDVMEWGTIWVLAVAHWTAGLGGAVIYAKQWPQITFACICVGTTLFLIWRGWWGKGVALLIVAAGLFLTLFTKLPDILVADGGGLVAVRAHDDLYFSSTRKDKFAAENWLRLSGRTGGKPLPFTDETFPYPCDEHGCRIEVRNQHVAVSFDHEGWQEDCPWANLVIATIPVSDPVCKQQRRVDDLFDFKEDGAHSYFIGKKGIIARSTAGERGHRPWTGR